MIAGIKPGVEGERMSPKHPETCAMHEHVLGKEEFRWVIAGLFAFFAGVIGFAAFLFASTDRVNGIDDRVKKVEATLEVVTDMNRKIDVLIEKGKVHAKE
jgi:hypothetical protein